MNSLGKNKSNFYNILDGFGSLPILHSQVFNE
jgi:hypothetical protein